MDVLKQAHAIIERRNADQIALSLSELLLLSVAYDSREMLQIARKNQAYIDSTLKEMGHDAGNGTSGVSGREDAAGA